MDESNQKDELLMYGYTRSMNIAHIPNEIALLLIKWISNVYFIHVDSDMMEWFLSKPMDDHEMKKAMDGSFISHLPQAVSVEWELILRNWQKELGNLDIRTWTMSKILTRWFHN